MWRVHRVTSSLSPDRWHCTVFVDTCHASELLITRCCWVCAEVLTCTQYSPARQSSTHSTRSSTQHELEHGTSHNHYRTVTPLILPETQHLCLSSLVDHNSVHQLRAFWQNERTNCRYTIVQDHRHTSSELWGVPVYSPAMLVLILTTHGGITRLSWPGWLVMYQDDYPIPVLTWLDVEPFHRCDQQRHHKAKLRMWFVVLNVTVFVFAVRRSSNCWCWRCR